MTTPKTIRVTCDTKLRIPLDQLHGIQGKLKEASVESYTRFRHLIEKRGLNFPIAVWKELVSAEVATKGKRKAALIPGSDPVAKWWVVDGHLRRLMLLKLRDDDGFTIPDLPCVEIEATDLADAKRQVLAASSRFHRVTADGLYEFMSELEMGMEDMADFELVDIDLLAFGSEYFDTTPEGGPEEPEEHKDQTSFAFSIRCDTMDELNDLQNLFGVTNMQVGYGKFRKLLADKRS